MSSHNLSEFDQAFFHSNLVKQAEKVLMITCLLAVVFGAAVNFYLSQSSQTEARMKVLEYDFKAAKSSLFTFIGSGYAKDSEETQKALVQLKIDLGLEQIFLTANNRCDEKGCPGYNPDFIWYSGSLGTGGLFLYLATNKPEFATENIIVGILLPIALLGMGLIGFRNSFSKIIRKIIQKEIESQEKNNSAKAVFMFIHELKRQIQPALNELNAVLPILKSDPVFRAVRNFEKVLDTAKDIAIQFINENKDKIFGSRPVQHKEVRPFVKSIELCLEKHQSNKNIIFFLDRKALLKFTEINPSFLDVWIETILSNALIHAVPFANKKDVEVFTELTESDGKQFFTVRIKDYGPPFSDAVMRDLELNCSKPKKKEDTNIGLIGVKKSIESIGGSLSLINALDSGKVVSLSIPVSNPPKWAFDISRIHQPIIILDDDSQVIEKVKNTISPHLLDRITIFTEERQFLEAVRANPTHFLVIDHKYQRSGRNGLELILQENLKSRCVLLTGEVPADTSLIEKAAAENIAICAKDYLISIPIHELGE